MTAVNPNAVYRVEKGVYVDTQTIYSVEKTFVKTEDRGLMFGSNSEIVNYEIGFNLLPDGKTVVSVTQPALPSNGKELADAVRQIYDTFNYRKASALWKAIAKELRNPGGFSVDTVKGVYRKMVLTSYTGLPTLLSHFQRFAEADGFTDITFNEDAFHIAAVWEVKV
jgi:hypothetical protein